MKSFSFAARAAILCLLALSLPSCERGERPLRERARDAAGEIRDAAEETAEELKKGAEEVQDALEDAGEEIRKGAEKAEEAWEE